MVTENARTAVELATVGAGVFFWAHHFLVPPQGHGPVKVIVMVMVDDAPTHAVRTNPAVAVIVPGAHFAVNTPADAVPALRMTGAVQPIAPATAALRRSVRRSNPPP